MHLSVTAVSHLIGELHIVDTFDPIQVGSAGDLHIGDESQGPMRNSLVGGLEDSALA